MAVINQILLILTNLKKYYSVDPNPRPIFGSLGSFCLTVGGVLHMHKYLGFNNISVKDVLHMHQYYIRSLFFLILSTFTWWQDVIRERIFVTVYNG